jgi:type I restriction enzyme S subunit
MLHLKTYSCGICNTKPDQISHHKSHIETQKHQDKRELFQFKLSKLSSNELEEKYYTTNIDDIINETETIICTSNYVHKKLKHTDLQEEKEIDIIHTLHNIMEQSNNVSNREALKDKIHEIHNFLRNNGAGYGMNALKVFNIIYGLKKIEENNLIDKVNLKKPDCQFSYLLSLANNDEHERIAELIFGDILTSISRSELKNLLFYEIPPNIKGSVLTYLIKEIDKITVIEKTCNVLLSGKIYEYFIGRDESAISELGAYFTDRHIVEYILKKLDPKINDDGSISTMVDMFGGSGGFTTGYINYLNGKYPNLINWSSEINKIYHYDMNEDVIKSAGLEFFCLTGVLPNMNNLMYKNSFDDEFENNKFRYPLTNPPYGGDKNKKSEAQTKREKIKEFIKNELSVVTDEGIRIKRQKQLKNIEKQDKLDKLDLDKNKVCLTSCSARIQKFAKNNKLSGNDKEACSLMLLMDIVEVGGTAIGVLKEGVFFNKTYKDLRKCLIENYNVREIISIPQDQFENTSTKTSILIFDNSEEKTVKVKFSDLSVERYTEDKFGEVLDEIVLFENKGDIKDVTDKLISFVSKEELLKNDICSLNGKDYNKKEMVVGDGYELVKLGDIADFLPKSKRNASFGQKEGQYNFYTSSDKVQKCDIADYNEEALIIGTGGIANIKIDNNFSCSADNFIMKTKYNSYVYSLFKGKMDLLSDGFTGSTLKHLSKSYLTNIQIPIPKSKDKIKEWVSKISKPYDKKNKNEEQIKELEKIIQNKIRQITEKEECDEFNLNMICDINPETLKNNQYQFINYIDISSVKDEKINNIQLFTNNYPSRAKRIIKKNDIIFSTVRPNLKGYTYIYNEIENGIVSTGFVVIRCKNINSKYIYTLLKDDKITEYLVANTTGSSYPAVNPSVFEKIKIKIPKNRQLIEDLEKVFQQIETLQDDVQKADLLYKQLIKELSEEAMPNQTYNQIDDPIDDSKDDSKDDQKDDPIDDPIEVSIEVSIDNSKDDIKKKKTVKSKGDQTDNLKDDTKKKTVKSKKKLSEISIDV